MAESGFDFGERARAASYEPTAPVGIGRSLSKEGDEDTALTLAAASGDTRKQQGWLPGSS